MTREVAFRASIIFVLFTALFASIGFASQVPAAEILFLISASLFSVLIFFAMTPQAHAPVPVRVRRRRR
jgi:hypothetical protein